MPDYFKPVEPGYIYHIFNRGNNGDRLFYEPRNYLFFLDRLQEKLSGFLQVYAYCLLPNHFHIVAKVAELHSWPFTKAGAHQSDTISEQFRRFFLGYAAAVKKQERRTGSLFEKNFKRLKVPNKDYLRYIINYTHQNPSKHGIVADFRHYSWSSYSAILSGTHPWVDVNTVIQLYGSLNNFVQYHEDHPVIERKG